MKTNDFIYQVVLQSVSFCNLNCDYCYLSEESRQENNILSLEVAETIFKSLLTSSYIGYLFDINWHAGEPLALPIRHYEAMFDKLEELRIQLKPDCKITHSIQTNGTLINQKWCDFFNKYHVGMGVSLDGPAFLHDLHRKYRNGSNSHAKTMKGIDLLRKNGIGFGILCVLTKDSLDYPDEIFHFFVENEFPSVAFNMEEKEAFNFRSSLDEPELEIKYKKFMERFWELTKKADGKLGVREFQNIARKILQNPENLYCETYKNNITSPVQSSPYHTLTIDCKGNFSAYCPELLTVKSPEYGDFIVGNLNSSTLESAVNTTKFQKIYKDICSSTKLCQDTCEHFIVCSGGFYSNKYAEHGTLLATETQACRLKKKIIFDIILEDIEKQKAPLQELIAI